MAFSDSFLEELAARSDIVDVVGSYVGLTRKSGGNQFGLCPFHSEKTASFSVSSDKQMYYCFGCHKGGGVINFIMEIESLPFPEAVHFLARRAGITVPDEGVYDEAMKRRERFLSANREAARFFRSMLSDRSGHEAVAYMHRRGINKTMVNQFGLGAAPDNWNALTDHLIHLGYTQDELVTAGLARRGKSGGIYDAFRGRLIFPVIDVRKNVLAFSGRILGDGEPKYLNTSDTPVFSKSRNLYGIHLARKSRADHFILVEGNVDVVSLHQAGFDSAVAPLGTALTADQARLIHQYKQEAIIAFDADSAGKRATDRAIGILEKTGIRVRVLRIPDGKDPDDFIKNHGADAFHDLIRQRETHIEYRLLSLRQTYDLERDPERVAFLQEAEKLLADLDSEVELEVYGRRVAEQTGVSLEGIKNGIKKRRAQKKKQVKKQLEKNGSRPTQVQQPKERRLHYQNAYSAMAEEGVLRLMFSDPELFQNPLPLCAEDFSSPFLGSAYQILLERLSTGKENTAATLAPLFPPEEMGQLMHLLTRPESLPDSRKSLADYIEKIQTEKLKQKTEQNPDENLQKIYAKYKELKGVE